MQWDDLQILAAVGATGSFSGAARSLGLNQSSISRRMRALEKRYDLRLFERQSHGLSLTLEGEELCNRVSSMSENANSVERHLQGLDTNLTGSIRFATIDSTGREIMPLLKKFLDLYPGIELTISFSQNLVNLTRNEADVVLRATNHPPETFIGRRVGAHEFAVFESSASFDELQNKKPLSERPWVVYSDGFTDQ